MYYEGDIRPVVKRVRPYKSLLLNLPPKSFGFWVIANTKVEACREIKNETELIEALPIMDDDIIASNSIKTKRSMPYNSGDDIDLTEYKEAIGIEMSGLKNRINNLNKELETVHTLFKKETKNKRRAKRQLLDIDNETALGKLKKIGLRHKQDKNRLSDGPKNRFEPLRKLLETVHSRLDKTRVLRHDRGRKTTKMGKHNMHKRNSHIKKAKMVDTIKPNEDNETIIEHKSSRRRRSILSENDNVINKRKDHSELEEYKDNDKRKKHNDTKKIKQIKHKQVNHDYEESSIENEIASDNDKANLWKILRQIHKQLEDLPIVENENIEYVDDSKDIDQIIVKTKLSDDRASVNFSEKSEHGLLKSTVENVLTVLADLNKNLHRFWEALSLLE